MSKKTILVTGGSGFAGRHLLDLLAVLPGTGATFATYLPTGAQPAPRAGVSWIPCDIRVPSDVRSLVARSRPSLVYHLAAAVTVRNSWNRAAELIQTNVGGTYNLLDAIREEVPEASVVLTSSAEVYGSVPRDRIPIREDVERLPRNPYGFSKYGQEEVCSLFNRVCGMRILVARPFHYTGPGQPPTFACSSLARQIAEVECGLRKEILVGNLDAERDFTDIRDIVRAYAMIAEAGVPERPYNVCRGEGRTIRSVLDFLIGKASVEVPVRVDPTRLRASDVPRFVGDGSRIRDEIGWYPLLDWDDMLSEILDAWRGDIHRERAADDKP